MKLYVAGPMRGYPEHNYPAFFEAAGKIRTAGHVVYNPAEHDAGALRANLASDLAWIGLVADGIVLLPGWESSLGANAEVALARAIGIPVWELDNFLVFGDAVSGEPCTP